MHLPDSLTAMAPPLHRFVVSPRERGSTLAAFLKQHLNISWSVARKLIAGRLVRVAGQTCADDVRRLLAGQVVEIQGEQRSPRRDRPTPKPAAKTESRPAPAFDISLRYFDEVIAVVEKPFGLTTMRHAEEAAEFGARAKHYLPKTLADVLPGVLGQREPVFPVHRLDRDTTGLVVFALTKDAESHLGQQFRAHTIARKYVALVRGRATSGRIESVLVRDRGDGRRGSGPEPGQRAVTHVTVVETLGDYSLVECRLETGRTHQVRIHLGEAETPICGETIYDRPLNGAPIPDLSGAPRLMLHAKLLGFEHPSTGAWMQWESPMPADMETVVLKLRKSQESAGEREDQRGDGQPE